MIKSQPSSTEVTYLEDLRKEFIDWKKRMKVTDTELGKGLNISRGTIGKFIKGEEATLNIKRHKIESLFNHVTSEDAIKKIKNGDAQTNRKELRAKTVYYLLKKAGFSEKEERAKLPISSEEDLSLSQRFEKIRFRLSNQSLTNSDVWQIEEMVINQLAQIHSRIENRDDFIKLDRVNEWLQNQYVYAEDYWREVESTLKRYKDLGREKFNKSEVLELFQSIAENQMSRISDIQNIRVIRCEMRTINSVYTRLENKQHGSVLEEISIAGTSAEKVLRGLKEEKSPFTPLNEVKLTCMLGNGGNRKSITWFYRSCSSTMDNMISAIQEGTGHNLKLKDLSSHVLAEGSDSMVRVSAILKNDGGNFYSGRWVDIDTISSFAQAIIIAVESWIKEEIATRKLDDLIYQDFADILREIDLLTRKAYEYGLSSTEPGEQFPKNDRLINKNYTVNEFTRWINKINTTLSNLQQHKSIDPSASYIKNLKINQRQAKLAKSKFYHVVGEVGEARRIIEEIRKEKDLEQKKESVFDMNSISFESESMMQKFYTSDREFFDEDYRDKKLKRIEGDIKRYLSSGKGINLLTDSFYRSVAELYGNFGRFDFYNCGTKSFDKERLEKALEYSKIAAYFAMKTDDEKRASHWLARCGRILCRLDRDRQASEYIDASGIILIRSTTLQYQYQERSDALMLEVNIAKGEQQLLRNEYKKSIKYFIDAIQGAIYLRVPRILAGSLYGMFRACTQSIEVAEAFRDDKIVTPKRTNNIIKSCDKLEEIISRDRSRLNEDEDLLKINNNHQITLILYESIMILKEVIENDTLSSTHISRKFKNQAIKIWNKWVYPSGEEHCIARLMEDNIFLEKCNYE